MPDRISAREALRSHWPEYLIEAWALGTFMFVAGAATTLFEYPRTRVHAAIADPTLRRALIGLAMGATAVLLIYSPWGRRSGAHMNPAVTLAFLSLGRVAPWDAAFYGMAQCVGGVLGVGAAVLAFGAAFAQAPIRFIATVPGPPGPGAAFAAELVMSFALMLTILIVMSRPRWGRYTGWVAGLLVAGFIALEAPLSGMSINPARSLASALPSGIWTSIWIYLLAPCLGMWLATRVYLRIGEAPAAGCAKLRHTSDQPCIHCGYAP
jgi:aquaporin Z